MEPGQRPGQPLGAMCAGKDITHMTAAPAAPHEQFEGEFERYLQHARNYRGLRPKTIDAYRRDAARFAESCT